MRSINLLSENEREEQNEQDGVVITKFFSFVLIVFLISFFAYFFIQSTIITKDIKSLDLEMASTDKRLNNEINKNKFLLSEDRENEISFLLSNHYYPSKVISFLQDKFIDEIYLNSLTITMEEGDVKVDFNGSMEDYSSLATQLYLLKNLKEVKKVSIKNVLKNQFGYEFEGSIDFDRNIALYSQNNN